LLREREFAAIEHGRGRQGRSLRGDRRDDRLPFEIRLVLQEGCHRRRKKLKPDVVEQRGKLDCLHDSLYIDNAKASIAQKLLKLRWIGEGMLPSLDPRGFRPKLLVERPHEGVRPRGPFDRAVNTERDPALLAHHAAHLLQGLYLVREELQSKLA